MNYKHLTINERVVISQLKSSGYSIRKIAKFLDRSPSTISRELKRNSIQKGKKKPKAFYSAAIAQDKYIAHKSKCGRKCIDKESLVSYLKEKIEDHWSPEQISNRKNKDLHIPSTSTIYRMINQKRLGLITMKQLRRKGKFKRPAETRGRFNDGGRTIKKRAKEIYGSMENRVGSSMNQADR